MPMYVTASDNTMQIIDNLFINKNYVMLLGRSFARSFVIAGRGPAYSGLRPQRGDRSY